MKFKIDIEALNNIGNLKSKWERANQKGLKYCGFKMMEFLMESPPTPVDHGLLSSWYHEQSSPNEFVIRTPANYAIYQNAGAKPHVIKPRNKKALFWEDAPHPWDEPPHPFAKVNHPGFEGKHFVEKSYNKLKPLIKELFHRAYMEELYFK